MKEACTHASSSTMVIDVPSPRFQSTRAPRGTGLTGDLRECAAQKSTANVWRRHENMDQDLMKILGCFGVKGWKVYLMLTLGKPSSAAWALIKWTQSIWPLGDNFWGETHSGFKYTVCKINIHVISQYPNSGKQWCYHLILSLFVCCKQVWELSTSSSWYFAIHLNGILSAYHLLLLMLFWQVNIAKKQLQTHASMLLETWKNE